MVEETPASSVTEVGETTVSNALGIDNSNVATIESNGLGGTESTCNNDNNFTGAETSAATSDEAGEKSLEMADELMEKGSKALKEDDYCEASDCFSRALEIRVARFGELSPECVYAYYKYGCALLYKAQEEADPLGAVPKKEGESQQDSAKGGSVKNVINRESSVTSVSSKLEDDASVSKPEDAANHASNGQDQDEDGESSDNEDLAEAEADEDESDLDLAWKMLDVARAIVEKQSDDTMLKVDILSTLAEVAMEREDIETSLSDYQKALSILERLVEPDSRHLAELNFRICLCLENGSNPEEAIIYCQKAISVCKARIQRLTDVAKSPSESTASSSAPEADKQVEIETLNGLSGDLEKKLEDLQQLVSNPKSILAEILGIAAAKAKGSNKSESSAAPPALPLNSTQMGAATGNGGFDSPTASTAHTSASSGVTHLGVVGRGVKRVVMTSATEESSPAKKPALDSSENKGDGSTS
ncbi:hypothetical protein UlMin_039428 [Ulmus minor]